jgi:hypothetical protein
MPIAEQAQASRTNTASKTTQPCSFFFPTCASREVL